MIVVDMESSGLEPEKHSLLSIGAIEFENPENQFYGECRIWDGAHVDNEALVVNGFTKSDITNSKKQTESELVKKFVDWASICKERTIAGQNPSEDRDMIREAAKRCYLDWKFAYRIVDLHSIAYYHIIKRGLQPPETNNHSALSLDKILLYVGLPTEPKPHNGLVGAQMEAEAFSRLFNDKPLLPEFASQKIPWLA